MVVTEQFKQWIKMDEDLKLMPYFDTSGKLTIGWGRNIQDCGIRADEAQLMFDNDLNQCIKELDQYDWYNSQPEGVKQALINMNFNLGIDKLLEFKGMILALRNKNYTCAAKFALDSLWSLQVGDRAKQVAVMIGEGK